MQQKHRQNNGRDSQPQYQFNKLNYHLKKTQPFKYKAKRTVTQQMKAYHRHEKVSTITNNKKYINKQTKKVEETDFDNINQEHINQNIVSIASQVKIYQTPGTNRKNVFERENSDSRIKKLDVVQRGKSLKYWKVEKSQPKFMTHIRGFFNTFLSQDDGCKCGPTCECKQILLKWVNVSQQLIDRNYQRLLSIAYYHEYDKSQKSSKYGMTQFSNQQYSDYLQQSSQQRLERSKHQIQIQKDIIRTQTQCELFHRKSIQNKLQKILMCYIVQDPEVGYVQSMNIVVSGVLYHVRDEAQTYAICRKIFHQIRKIYLNDFKQCYLHVDHIIKLFQTHIYDLYKHLQQIGVELKVILFSWVLSLLCVVVPLQYLHLVYIGFVKENWKFIYKTILALYVYHKDKLKSMDQSGDVLVFLSVSNEEGKNNVDWEDIINFGYLKITI